MDLEALMQAAQQDPSAAQFIQQLLSGGASMMQRMPEIQRQELHAPDIQPMESAAPLPVFEPVKSRVDDLLAKWSPPATGAPLGDPGILSVMEGAPPAGGAPAAPAGPAMGMPGIDPVTQSALPLSPEQQAQQMGQGTMPPTDLVSLLRSYIG